MQKLLLSLLLSISVSASAEVDPLEDFNRSMFEFNKTLDDYIFEPVARSYQKSTPKSVQNGVNNFMGNLSDIGTLTNQLLQFKPFESATTFKRILLNTTVGIGGLFDIANNAGLKKTNEDFGQTMGVWGVKSGAYIILPILGPSSLRDATGLGIDVSYNVRPTKELPSAGQNTVILLNTVNTKAKLLPTTDLLKKSVEPYVALRSSYLQKRKYDVFDGNVPSEDDEF